MEKPKIYAVGNRNVKSPANVSYYIIEKNDKFLDWFSRLVINILEIKEGSKKVKFILDENGEIVREKDISKMVDLHEHYESPPNRVDVFYGVNRVYITFYKSEEKRKKIGEYIEKSRDWIKVEEMQKLPEQDNTKELSTP